MLVLLAATRRRALPRRFVLALTLVGCAPSAAPEDGPEVLARALEARPELADAFVAKGQRPLHWAAEHDDEETAAVLLAHGAAVDAADAEGRSALCVAARYDAPHVVSLLLDRQADVDASCDAFGDRPLHVAARYASAPLVQQLLRRANVDVTNHWGATALHAVALRRDESDGALMALLAAKPSLEVMDRRGFTALHAAVVRDRARTVELLMDAGAEPNVRSRTGETPYQLALASQADAVATRLVERGAGGVEEPPLFVAARTDDLPRLLALLPYAHIDGVHAGQTALQLAEACHSERAAAALRAHRWSAR